jgi:predicted permease
MSALGEGLRRVWYLLNRRRFDRALAEEMEAHREMMREPARFGNTLRLRERSRDAWGWVWVDDLARDVRLAARALRRTPGFTIVTLASLVIGLTLAASTIAVANAYLIRSLPYPEADRLYHVMYALPGPYEPGGMSALDWKSVNDVVEYPVTAASATVYLADGGLEQPFRARRVNTGFMQALGVRASLGRTFSTEEVAPTSDRAVMIGDGVWRERFGADSGVIGRVFRAEGGSGRAEAQTFRIVGVLPPGFWYGRGSSALVDILMPLTEPERTYMVRLRPGVPVGLAERRITGAARAVGTSLTADWSGVRLESAHERYVGPVRPVLLGATIVAGIVLLIACTNVAVLVLLRALHRQKEMAVRVALGAGRRHIARVLAAESAWLCGGAIVLVVTLAAFLLRPLAPLIERQLGRPAPGGASSIGVDSTVLTGLAFAAVAIALSLCLVPLATPWRRHLADTLRSAGRADTDRASMRRIRGALIGLELAGSFMLLVACGMMLRSVVQMIDTDLGFRTDGLARVRVVVPARTYPDDKSRYAFYRRVTGQASSIAGGKVALTSWPPFVESLAFPVIDESGGARAKAGVTAVGPDYFAVLRIAVREGRVFSAQDREGAEPVAVIGGAVARRLWPGASAVGHRVRVVERAGTDTPSDTWRTIVGVVDDVRQGYADTDVADVYVPFFQVPPDVYGAFYVQTAAPAITLATSLRAAVSETDSQALVRDVLRADDENRQLLGTRFLTALLSAFALFAAFLAVVGMYGVIAYAVGRRQREFAIRVALGATRQTVTALSMRSGGLVLALGLAAGGVAASGAGRVLRSQLYGVPQVDLWSLLGAGGLLALAGLLAIWLPAHRAASVDPVTVLREQ